MNSSDESSASVQEIPDAVLVEEPGTLPPYARELLTIGLLVALADITIYRSHGFAGFSAWFVLSPPLLHVGSARSKFGVIAGLMVGMLCMLACRLVWYGSVLQVSAGLILLLAFAASLVGIPPGFVPLAMFASQVLPAGYRAYLNYWKMLRRNGPQLPRANWLNIALPFAALVIFSLLFVLANPDMVTFLGSKVERLLEIVRSWIVNITLRPTEVMFWLAVAWIAAGLLRPVIDHTLLPRERSDEPLGKPTPAALYIACRNTLVTVIVLFAFYLVFEFKTLWFREFPDGFYYAGYAHEGAAWLTVALALATVILSVVFRGPILVDPRLPALRRLAWAWSAQNVLLAVAVYNRLFIYVGFNGMTRMRIIGFFGISAVVAGFVLVVWKIAKEKNFTWLVRRQIWALALTVYLFALTPVDNMAVSYNVRRILRGDPAACMQIGVQPLDTEGLLAVTPLLQCRDGIIRDGVAALLAQRAGQLERQQQHNLEYGWTTFQLADRVALRRLNRLRNQWSKYADPNLQDDMLQRFHNYAYQWY